MTVSKNVLMALLILSYATWGGGMIAMKYAFESFTAMQVVFARVAFAGVIYLALYRLWSHIPYQKGDWKYLLAMVLFEPCLFFLCETFAMTYTTASSMAIMVFLVSFSPRNSHAATAVQRGKQAAMTPPCDAVV